MHKTVYCITIFLLLFFKAPCQSDLRFWHLNSANGLSGSSVKSILQDQKGFVWIGTDFGLNRYDAKNIISFKNNPADSTSIPGNKIKRIGIDKNGLLWIVTDEGVCSFNSSSEKFTRYPLYAGNEKIKIINDIFIDSKNNYHVATDEKGWGILDLTHKKYLRDNFSGQEHDADLLKKIYSLQAFAEDNNGTMYFGSRVYSLIIQKNKQYSFPYHTSTVYPYPAHTISTIFCDSKNRIWIGAWDNALHKYDPVSDSLTSIFIDKTKKIEYSGNEINCINEDENGWLWIGTRRNGLYLYNPLNGEVRNFTHNYFDKNSISNNTIRCIYRDKNERMWLGTESGVDVFDPLLNQFEVHYLNDDLNSSESVNDFLEDENILYVATDKGLDIENEKEKTHQLKQFFYNNELITVNKLFKDSYGTIYVGTNKTIFILDKKTLNLKTFNTFYKRDYAFDFYNIASSRIVSMTQSRWHNHDVLWLSPFGHGLGGFDIKTQTGFVTPVFQTGTNRYEHLINKIFVDSKQNIFCLMGRNGITRNFTVSSFADSIFNLSPAKEKNVFAYFDPITADFLDTKIHNLPSDVFDMIEIAEDVYWVTSTSGGLYKLDLANNKYELTRFENPYPNMYGMEKDGDGNLWIISSAGIEFFNVTQNSFYHFDAKDGIPDYGLQRYFYKDQNGFLYAGGKGYYLRFKPEQIKFNAAKPNAVITHFKIFDRVADSLLKDEVINLSYKQNHFSFEFASLSFTNAEDNAYSYMLEGIDQAYVSAGTRNFASYTNLDGGHYQFKVKTSNNNNVWSDAALVSIYIQPPLWQYKWFYPILILILSAIGFLLYRNRLRNMHRNQTEKFLAEIDAQEKERRRIARDLHDEFGTKMSALKIYLSTFEKFVDHKNEEAVKTKKELYSIVDDSMYDLRSLLMDLSPKTMEMHGFAVALTDLTNRLNNTHLFYISCYVASQLEKFDAKYELTVFRIIQELLNNSIKHSGCKEINVQLFYRDKNIVLNYDDDGKGFDFEKIKPAGYGLKNIETRVSLLNGKVRWDTSPGNGINVTVEIPFEIKNDNLAT